MKKPTAYTVTSTLTKRAQTFANVRELRGYLVKLLKRCLILGSGKKYTTEELEALWAGLDLLKPGDTVHWLRWTIAVN